MKRLLILIILMMFWATSVCAQQTQAPAQGQKIGPQSPPIAGKILNPPKPNDEVQTGIDQNTPTGIQETEQIPQTPVEKKELNQSTDEYIKSRRTP